MILSLLYRLTPKQCRLIMIDPKMLELSVYDNIPHLLSPGRDRSQEGDRRAEMGRGRDGGALSQDVQDGRAQHRRLQRAGARRLERGEDFSRTVQTGFDEETGEPIFETETFEPRRCPSSL